MNSQADQSENVSRPKRYVRAVGPRLRLLLNVVFLLFALLAANSAYLVSLRLLEWVRGQTYQNYFYQFMFLGHLVIGLLILNRLQQVKITIGLFILAAWHFQRKDLMWVD